MRTRPATTKTQTGIRLHLKRDELVLPADATTAEQIRARAKQVKARGRRRKRAPMKYPVGPETSYAQELIALMKFARKTVQEKLYPALDRIFAEAAALVRADAYSEIISEVFDDIEVEYARVTARRQKEIAKKAAKRVADFNKKDTSRVIKSILGLDVLQSEPWLDPIVDLFTRDNVALIESIPRRFFSEIEDLVRESALSGRRPESLLQDFQERYDVSESRARLLARDQVSKFNGELTRVRQGKLGITSYIWRTSLDERVRESHKAQEGLTYKWADAPSETGHPGADYQCRCTAEPILDDLDE